MKRISRGLLTGAGIAAAAALAVVSGPGMASAATPAPGAVSLAAGCSATVSVVSVSGNCTVSTVLGTFGGSFSGTVGAGGNGSGSIVLDGGVLGNLNGTWSGGPFTGGSATINYTVQGPLGPVSGSFMVAVSS